MSSDDLLQPMRGDDWSELFVEQFPELVDLQDLGDEIDDVPKEGGGVDLTVILMLFLVVLSVLAVIGFGITIIVTSLIR